MANADDDSTRGDGTDTEPPDARSGHADRGSGVIARARFDRRTVLRALGGSGVAVGVAVGLGARRGLSPPRGSVEVVTARVHGDDGSGRTELTKTVPAAWHAAVETAFDLHESLARTRFPWYLGSAVEPDPLEEGTVRVSLGFDGSERGSTPPDVSLPGDLVGFDGGRIPAGVSVVPEGWPGHRETRLLAAGEEADTNTERKQVPGGTRCESPVGGGTLAPAVYHPETDGPAFATALHIYDGVDDPLGAPLSRPLGTGTDTHIGRITARFPTEDVAIATPVGGVRPRRSVRNASTDRIVGQYTRWGLAILAAHEAELEAVGASSDRSSGRVQGVDARTRLAGTRWRRGQLKWGDSGAMTDGDSGSVAYDPDPDGVDGGLVAAFNLARTWWPGQNFVWGTAAYELTRRHGYHF